MFYLFINLLGYDDTVIFADLLDGLPHDIVGLKLTEFAAFILVGEVVQFLFKLRQRFLLNGHLLFVINFQALEFFLL